MKSKKGKVIQVSKEYYNGKWQKVEFVKIGNEIIVRLLK